jgi:hypothetical protein
MKVHGAALVLALSSSSSSSSYVHAGKYASETVTTSYFPENGYSTGTCLNSLYQVYHPESTLTCEGNKFWKTVSLKAPTECVMGQRLNIEELTFVSTFTSDAYDFAVS